MRYRRVNFKRLFRAVLSLALIACFIIAGVSSCRLLTGRTLRVGLYESSRPLTFLDDKKVASGFEADFARMLAEKLGKKPMLRLLALEDMAAALEDGEVDCVVSVREFVHAALGGAPET
ncbi:MAG: transporter substrate-binding domain-containing protein, partial [Clostridiales bacterium]|nr:transporter substrate-binding domain-containing protein [Clostridiales bacterium]